MVLLFQIEQGALSTAMLLSVISPFLAHLTFHSAAIVLLCNVG